MTALYEGPYGALIQCPEKDPAQFSLDVTVRTDTKRWKEIKKEIEFRKTEKFKKLRENYGAKRN